MSIRHRIVSCALVIAALSTAGASAGVTLEVEGACPGPMIASAGGPVQHGLIALVYSPAEGEARVPSGPCAGTPLGLSPRGIRYLGAARGDENGVATFRALVPRGACGGFIQAIDISPGGPSCETSNVVQL